MQLSSSNAPGSVRSKTIFAVVFAPFANCPFTLTLPTPASAALAVTSYAVPLLVLTEQLIVAFAFCQVAPSCTGLVCAPTTTYGDPSSPHGCWAGAGPSAALIHAFGA